MDCVERLEGRRLLSGAGIWWIDGFEDGTDYADDIVVEAVPGRAGWLRAVVNGQQVEVRTASSIKKIVVNGWWGNDLVRVRLGAEFAGIRTILKGGDGDDVLIGGAGRDALRGGPGNDRLDGRGNVDVLDGQRGSDRILRREAGDLAHVGQEDRLVMHVAARMIKTRVPASEPDPSPDPWYDLPEPQPLDTSPATTVTDAMNRFAFALYRELVKAHGHENLMFSPTSLATMLSMLIPGAQGETLDQILAALRLPSDTAEVLRQFETLTAPVTGDPPYTFTTANAVWYNNNSNNPSPLLDDYTRAVRKAFAAVVEGLDMTNAAAAERVFDQWAADHTDGMIKDIVGPDFFDAPLDFVLGDAVYFKGNWADPFSPRYTNRSDFHLADGSTAQASIMNKVGGFNVYVGTGFDMTILPYEGGRFSMLVLLPRAVDGLDELVQSVTPELLNQWVPEATGQMGGTWIGLPKFAFSTRLETEDLEGPLEALGMTDAFSPSDADLSGMTGGGDGLHLNKVVHGARIEVSEEGTRAAGVSLGGGGVCAGPFYFIADHPFMFAIRDDQTGAIQFLGQVTNPS